MPRPWPEEKTEHLRGLVAQGMSAGEIAKVFRVTRNAILGKLDRIGVALAGATKQRQVRPTPRREHRTVVPRAALAHSQRPVWGTASPPRRFSWQEPVDTHEERA